MATRDEEVGRTLATLRGARSQKVVADEMRKLGWKWSQATVWSVESGERPLRLLEATDLAEILGVHLSDFFGDKARTRQNLRFKKLQNSIPQARRAIRNAVFVLLANREELRRLSSGLEKDGLLDPYDAKYLPTFTDDHGPVWTAQVAEERFYQYLKDGDNREVPKELLEAIENAGNV